MLVGETTYVCTGVLSAPSVSGNPVSRARNLFRALEPFTTPVGVGNITPSDT